MFSMAIFNSAADAITILLSSLGLVAAVYLNTRRSAERDRGGAQR